MIWGTSAYHWRGLPSTCRFSFSPIICCFPAIFVCRSAATFSGATTATGFDHGFPDCCQQAFLLLFRFHFSVLLNKFVTFNSLYVLLGSAFWTSGSSQSLAAEIWYSVLTVSCNRRTAYLCLVCTHALAACRRRRSSYHPRWHSASTESPQERMGEHFHQVSDNTSTGLPCGPEPIGPAAESTYVSRRSMVPGPTSQSTGTRTVHPPGASSRPGPGFRPKGLLLC